MGAIVASWVPRLEHVPDDRGEPSEGAQLFVSSLHSRVIDWDEDVSKYLKISIQ